MRSETWTIQQVFQDRRQFKVPFYQRAYVWTLKDQWELLWADIRGKAEERLGGVNPAPHFLGAIVIEPQERASLRGVEIAHVIDGQQRLTTLQYVLTGFGLAARELGFNDFDPILATVMKNPNPDTMLLPEIESFKVWPTFSDQKDFVTSMTAGSLSNFKTLYPDHFTQAGQFRKIGIAHPGALASIWSFAEWAEKFIQENGGVTAADALLNAVLRDLKVVVIELEKGDDAQVIFETLNGRGAELHATDLIRNHLFMSVDPRSENPQSLYEKKWRQFEDGQWKVLERRGRLSRPRLEWLVYSVIRAETAQEGDLGRLYSDFKDYTKTLSTTQQLDLLDTYGSHYLDLIKGTGQRPIARFGRRLQAYDTTTTHPLALKISTATVTDQEKSAMFDAIASYVVRRAACGLNTKNYNNFFMSVLRQLSRDACTHDVLVRLLDASGSEASRWPDDAEFAHALTQGPIYPGRFDPVRCRTLLTEIEAWLRLAQKTEEPNIPDLSNLDIDHIMPQSWFAHWPLPDGTKATSSEASAAHVVEITGGTLSERQSMIRKRDKAIATLGNLSLLNLSVNREAQHKAFPIKKELLIEHTNLSLNVKLIALNTWDEDAIAARGALLAAAAVKLYPRAAAVTQ